MNLLNQTSLFDYIKKDSTLRDVLDLFDAHKTIEVVFDDSEQFYFIINKTTGKSLVSPYRDAHTFTIQLVKHLISLS